MTVVVGTVCWIAGNRAPGWSIEKVPFWRDSLMLLLATSFVLLVAADGVIFLWEALGFLCLHAVGPAWTTTPALGPCLGSNPSPRASLNTTRDRLSCEQCYITIVLILPRIQRCIEGSSTAPADTGTRAVRAGQMDATLIDHAHGMDGSLQWSSRRTDEIGGPDSLPPLVVAHGTQPGSVQIASPLASSRGAGYDLPVARGAHLEPLQFEAEGSPANLKNSRSSSMNSIPNFVSLWGADANSTAAVQSLWGGGAAGGVNGGSGGDGVRAPMEGIDCPSDASLLGRIGYVLELPMSVLRWLTIPSSDGEWDGRRRAWTACTPPLAAIIFSFEYYGDVPTALSATVSADVPVYTWCVLLGVGLCLSALVYLSSADDAPPKWMAVSVVAGFGMTIVWLDIIANEMIALIETIGHILNISTSILGLTVVAIGNSVGDFVADGAAAREGSVGGARMAIAACFGSPVIMNIVSLGLSFGLRLLLTNGHPIHYEALSRLARLGYMLLYLTLFSHLIVFPMCGYRAPRVYAIYLYTIYATLLVVSCLIEVSGPDGSFPGEWLCRGPFYFAFGDCPGGCA